MFYGWLVAVEYMTSLPDEPGADGRSVATLGGFLFLLVWRGLGTVRLIAAAPPASPAPVRASAVALATRAHQKLAPLMCRPEVQCRCHLLQHHAAEALLAVRACCMIANDVTFHLVQYTRCTSPVSL